MSQYQEYIVSFTRKYIYKSSPQAANFEGYDTSGLRDSNIQAQLIINHNGYKEDVFIYKRFVFAGNKNFPFLYSIEKTTLAKKLIFDWVDSIKTSNEDADFINARFGDGGEYMFYKVPLLDGELFVNYNVTIQFNSYGAPIRYFLNREPCAYSEYEVKGWLYSLGLKIPGSFCEHKAHIFELSSDFIMLVAPEFHIILLRTNYNGFIPICGRVYEDDCEYNETTERGREEMEVEEKDWMEPPITHKKEILLNKDGPKVLTNKIGDSSSPILKVEGGNLKFSYFEIKGDDVEKVVKVSSLTASGGSTEVVSNPNNPLNRTIPSEIQAPPLSPPPPHSPPPLSQPPPHSPPPPSIQQSQQPSETTQQSEKKPSEPKIDKEAAIELITFLNENFKQIMGTYKWTNKVRCIPRDLLTRVLISARSILSNEPTLAQVTSDGSQVCIFGDVHGSYRDLRRFIDLLDIDNPDNRVKLVFLGDYVDRGTNAVETFAYLLSLKIIYPDRITLLMGNHELSNHNNIKDQKQSDSHYYFQGDIINVYGYEYHYKILCDLRNVLWNLPLAAIIDGKVYCAHGGIPRFWNEAELRDFIKEMKESVLRKPLWDKYQWNKFNDITTSDPLERGFEIPQNEVFPADFYVSPRIKVEGQIDLKRYSNYPCGFTEEALKMFSITTGTKFVVRAHQHSDGHYSMRYSNTLLTVFTSTELMSINRIFFANVVVWTGSGFKIIALSNDEARKRLVRR